MKNINFFKLFFFINLILFTIKDLRSEIIIMSSCNNKKDGFLKNEYILNLEESTMTRNYIYNKKIFKKYRTNDISVKKENTVTKFIYTDDDKILTDKIGYPQFYTQLIFEIGNPNIKIKTVINNEVGISKISTCKKIEKFQKES